MFLIRYTDFNSQNSPVWPRNSGNWSLRVLKFPRLRNAGLRNSGSWSIEVRYSEGNQVDGLCYCNPSLSESRSLSQCWIRVSLLRRWSQQSFFFEDVNHRSWRSRRSIGRRRRPARFSLWETRELQGIGGCSLASHIPDFHQGRADSPTHHRRLDLGKWELAYNNGSTLEVLRRVYSVGPSPGVLTSRPGKVGEVLKPIVQWDCPSWIHDGHGCLLLSLYFTQEPDPESMSR